MTSGIEERDVTVSYTVGDLTIRQATPWTAAYYSADQVKVIDARETDPVKAVTEHGLGWEPIKRPVEYWAPSGVLAETAGTDWHPMTVDSVTVGILVVEGVPTMAKLDNDTGELWVNHATNDCHAVTRSDDHSHVGRTTVGKTFAPFSNVDTAEFLQSLVGDNAALETMGSLHNGRQFWAMVRLDREITVAGEAATPYLLICNSHDGTGKLKVMAVVVRVVCANTLAMATSSARQSWNCRHTGKLEQRVAEARSSLKLGWRYFDAFEEEVAKLIATPVTSTQFVEFTEALHPMPEPKVLKRADDGTPMLLEAASTRTVNAVEAQRGNLRALWNLETGAGNHKGNAYGALQTVSTNYLHGLKGRGDTADEVQQRHVLNGASTKVLADAQRTLATVLAN